MKNLLFWFGMMLLITACNSKDASENTKSLLPEKAPLTLDSAGYAQFSLGNDIIPAGSYGAYTITRDSVEKNEEGVMVPHIYYTVKKEADTLVVYEENGGKIYRLLFYSEQFKTVEGIGAGNSLKEFFAAYPKGNVWYSYVGVIFIAEQDTFASPSFVIDPSSYKGDTNKLSESDMVYLSPEDFSDSARIITARFLR